MVEDMTKVIADMSVFLDDFLAVPHHGVGQLFGYAASDDEVPESAPGHPAVPHRSPDRVAAHD